jgi:hypothetical protein
MIGYQSECKAICALRETLCEARRAAVRLATPTAEFESELTGAVAQSEVQTLQTGGGATAVRSPRSRRPACHTPQSLNWRICNNPRGVRREPRRSRLSVHCLGDRARLKTVVTTSNVAEAERT